MFPFSNKRRASSVSRRQRGVAATELALVLPLLLLLLLGAADFGRFAHTWIAVASASRAGAGYGGMNPFTSSTRSAWEAGIRRSVEQEMEGVKGYDANQLSVVIATQIDVQGRQRVSVQVTYPFHTLIDWALLPSSLQLRQKTVLPMIR